MISDFASVLTPSIKDDRKIKSNFQCRAVFSMASRWDSRVALNKYGAEKLKGNGDGIFRTNNGQSNIRFQAPYVHEKEINDVVSILCKQKRGYI